MTWLLVLTVICLAVPLYVYVGYPVLLWAVARCRRSPMPEAGCPPLPSVTLVISCYNEAAVIRAKLENSLALDYPKERLRILVVSDGSDDGTDEIVRAYADDGVCLVRQEGRLGKTMGLNLAMTQVDTDITVFSDANAMYDPGAIRELVRGFADPNVGYVVGAALYTDGDAGASARSEGLYWRYELAIKTLESRVSSVVGGDGAIYAIRTHLWQPLDQRDINDFVNPLQIVARGYRGLFQPQARCYEETAGDFGREVARKERIVNRSIRGLFRVRAVMNPFRSGWFAWQVISHKLLRWLIPCFLALGLAGSAWLSAVGLPLFTGITLLGAAVISAALVARLTGERNVLPVWLSLPYYFVMVNLYSVKGVWRALTGKTQVTWASARTASNGATAPVRWVDPITMVMACSVVLLLVSVGVGYAQ
ncbi:glycosyltransferase family 2 protein [Marinobacter lutaoensis]|uniref:glycosyltransferase family 2 protein n=1 Tax=Marinobacter lutaoensis TaxID=135739 RepID=UPI000A01DD0A|nr:glycosyltransferase family 2 protein [Marinobacter lutaoensis]